MINKSDSVINRMITDRIGLHSVLLPLLIGPLFPKVKHGFPCARVCQVRAGSTANTLDSFPGRPIIILCSRFFVASGYLTRMTRRTRRSTLCRSSGTEVGAPNAACAPFTVPGPLWNCGRGLCCVVGLFTSRLQELALDHVWSMNV